MTIALKLLGAAASLGLTLALWNDLLSGEAFVISLALAVLVFCQMIPAMIARRRRHLHFLPIAVLCVALTLMASVDALAAWADRPTLSSETVTITIGGWIVALVWSLMPMMGMK